MIDQAIINSFMVSARFAPLSSFDRLRMKDHGELVEPRACHEQPG
jgi:hypothetical protein